jgi:hypothetical protein
MTSGVRTDIALRRTPDLLDDRSSIMPSNVQLQCCRCAAFTLAIMWVASAQICLAQKPPRDNAALSRAAQLSAKQTSMSDMLATLSASAHISILADGEPVLKKADVICAGTLREALDKVADTFDYTWSITKGGIVLLSKRFKSPDERPQVNLPETLELMRNVVRALQTVDYDPDPSHATTLVREALQSFTPQQTHDLESGVKLSGASLLPQQKALLTQAIATRTFAEALRMWEAALPTIENMPISRVEARKRIGTNADNAAPGYDYFCIYRRSGGRLESKELRHTKYTRNSETLATP